MNVVMIIPTGIGCAIGGHAGDATPAAKLLASVCDKLILHPNVVNASDINEMPDNALYVEGSMLDRFLEGEIDLQEIKQNKILVAVNAPIGNHTINAVGAARATMGANIEIVELPHALKMTAIYSADGTAWGNVEGYLDLIQEVNKYKFDALAITTPITIPNDIMIEYFQKGGVNPIGGVEAIASKLIGNELNKPVAHAPFEEANSEMWEFNEMVNPALAAEMVSCCFLHCVLKGLHRAPRIGIGLSVNDIDVMVSPYGCWGRPHRACMKARIPIIIVEENTTCYGCLGYPEGDNWKFPNETMFAKNYLEATGYIAAMNAGIHPDSVRRPLAMTKVWQ